MSNIGNWYASDGNGEVLYTNCTRREAAQEFVDSGEWGDVTETIAVMVNTWPADDREDDESHLILLHRDEPACLHDKEHAWKETSLQSHGAGVRTRHECEHCDAIQHYHSSSQGYDNDTEFDHDTYRYEAGPTECECTSCYCRASAETRDESGTKVCATCAVYIATDDGEVICANETNGFRNCDACHGTIEWTGILTGTEEHRLGTCECREWRNNENGGSWDDYRIVSPRAEAASS